MAWSVLSWKILRSYKASFLKRGLCRDTPQLIYIIVSGYYKCDTNDIAMKNILLIIATFCLVTTAQGQQFSFKMFFTTTPPRL